MPCKIAAPAVCRYALLSKFCIPDKVFYYATKLGYNCKKIKPMKNIYPEYPCFPQDFISSFPCRKMSLEVFGFFNWFLMHSWVFSEKPCHLPTDMDDLKIIFSIDEQLLNNCVDRLLSLNKIETTEDGKYYFNQRLLNEYLKLQKRSEIYKNNRLGKGSKTLFLNKKQQLINNSKTIEQQADNDNDNDIDNNSLLLKEKKDLVKKIFVPPTKEEFTQYFLDNGYGREYAMQAYNGYDVADWHDSRGAKIKNWKQKANHVWFKPEKKTMQKQPQLFDVKAYRKKMGFNDEQ